MTRERMDGREVESCLRCSNACSLFTRNEKELIMACIKKKKYYTGLDIFSFAIRAPDLFVGNTTQSTVNVPFSHVT